MKLTKNFQLHEFDCKCGLAFPVELLPNVATLAFQLQVIRDQVKAPLFINSGYRTKEYNIKVGGSINSYHVQAMAVDFHSKVYSPHILYYSMIELMLQGKIMYGGIGLYDNFVHYDIRGHYVLFKY